MTPIHGWGWVDTPSASTDATPGPFDLVHVRRVKEGWLGEVNTVDYAFYGMTAQFEQRHVEWNGLVHLSVFSDSQLVAEGWGQVPSGFVP